MSEKFNNYLWRKLEILEKEVKQLRYDNYKLNITIEYLKERLRERYD